MRVVHVHLEYRNSLGIKWLIGIHVHVHVHDVHVRKTIDTHHSTGGDRLSCGWHISRKTYMYHVCVCLLHLVNLSGAH